MQTTSTPIRAHPPIWSDRPSKHIRVERLGRNLSAVIACVFLIFLLINFVIITKGVAEMLLAQGRAPLSNTGEAAVILGFIALAALAATLIARSGYLTLRFRIAQVPATACDGCQYDLLDNASGVCPKCGRPVRLYSAASPAPRAALHRTIFILGLVGGGLAAVLIFQFSTVYSSLDNITIGPGPAPSPSIVPPAPLSPITPGAGTITPINPDNPYATVLRGTVTLGRSDSGAAHSAGAPLADCVVYLRDANPPAQRQTPPPVNLDLTPAGFSRPVVCIRAGQTLTVRHRDTIARNFMTITRRNPPENRAVPSPGMLFNTTFKFAEMNIQIIDGMYTISPSSRLHVFGHPYFAVSDARGRFRFPAPPAGVYEIVCEHETHGRLVGSVEVSNAKGPPAIEIVYDDLAAGAGPIGE